MPSLIKLLSNFCFLLIILTTISACSDQIQSGSNFEVSTLTVSNKINSLSTITPTIFDAPTLGQVTPVVTLIPYSPTITSSPYITNGVETRIPKEWQYRWLKGIPCSPPCFEGVTPGLTKIDETAAILEKSSILDQPVKKQFTNKLGGITWMWKIQPRDNDNGGAAFYELVGHSK